MALVVRCQPVTADAWVGFEASPCGTYVGQIGTDTGFFFPPQVLWTFPVSIIPLLFHTHQSITNTIPE